MKVVRVVVGSVLCGVGTVLSKVGDVVCKLGCVVKGKEDEAKPV